MSKHPEAQGQTKKEWATPKLREITSHDEVIEILRSALQQVEKRMSEKPGDPKEKEIQRSLKRMLDDLKSGSKSTAA